MAMARPLDCETQIRQNIKRKGENRYLTKQNIIDKSYILYFVPFLLPSLFPSLCAVFPGRHGFASQVQLFLCRSAAS